MTILEAGALLRKRQVSSVELTRECLERIDRLQPRLNAFITVTAEHALQRARRADREIARGQWRGPLHGLPVAVKDVFCTKGVRTTCGSALFADFVPDRDAAAVERLEAAGAVLLGKTSLHELAYGITSANPHFGLVRNPWDTRRIPGGSSGGSGAAVAAGMAFMALGTDTGGSIRIPASFCGAVGLKPTTGRVSRYGVLPLDFTLDHVGPLAATVRDAAITLEVLAGHDPRDESSSTEPVPEYLPNPGASIRGLRVGVPQNFYFDRLDPQVERCVRAMINTAAELGAEIVPVRTPEIEPINTIGRLILLAEASAVMEPYLGQRDKFGRDVLALLDQGRLITATDYVNAQRLRRLACREFAAIWRQADCLLTPTTPTAAPEIGQTQISLNGRREDVRLASTRLVRALNVVGVPALSMPCGFTSAGLPVGLQIVAPPFREDRLLLVAAVLEDATASAVSRKPPPAAD